MKHTAKPILNSKSGVFMNACKTHWMTNNYWKNYKIKFHEHDFTMKDIVADWYKDTSGKSYIHRHPNL